MLNNFRRLRLRPPEGYRVRISDIFQEFIRQAIEDRLGIRLSTQRYARGMVFRHRADLMYEVGERPLLYVETKVIFRPERVRPDHDKRMYQIALASIDLKLSPFTTWTDSKRSPPCVAFALAIPSNTPQRDLEHVEDDMYKHVLLKRLLSLHIWFSTLHA